MKNKTQIRIIGLITTLILSVGLQDTIGQEISYYNNDWNLTTKDSAQFYFVTIDNIPRYRIGTIVKYSKRLEKHKKKIAKKVDQEIGETELREIDFTDSKYDSVYIGKKVKIYADREYYDYLCKSSNDSIDWPNREIKKKSGVCYDKWRAPNDGDFGVVIWQFRDFKSSTGRTVFIVQIDDYYIPITGHSLTLIDKLSRDEVEMIEAKKHPKRYLRKKNKIGQI